MVRAPSSEMIWLHGKQFRAMGLQRPHSTPQLIFSSLPCNFLRRVFLTKSSLNWPSLNWTNLTLRPESSLLLNLTLSPLAVLLMITVWCRCLKSNSLLNFLSALFPHCSSNLLPTHWSLLKIFTHILWCVLEGGWGCQTATPYSPHLLSNKLFPYLNGYYNWDNDFQVVGVGLISLLRFP